MPLILRPYQQTLYEQVRTLMVRGYRRILVQAPTGSGKTALTANMLGNALAKGMASLFNVHRRELVKQSIRAFGKDKADVVHGVIAGGFLKEYHHLTQIASVQTLAGRLDKLKHVPSLIIWDEAHHLAAGQWAKIFDAFPHAFHVGLTATPERLDGTGLGAWFDVLVEGPSVAWLIANGYLSPFEAYAPDLPPPDLSMIHLDKNADFIRRETTKALDTPTLTGDVVKTYIKRSMGKRALGFASSVEHSKHLVAEFISAGIPAVHVDGETDAKVRDRALESFEKGDTLVVFNVELFGEGTDIPAVETGILVRPTLSLGLHLQQCGRILRPAPGKSVALLLDHAGNCERHGLPDEPHKWSLEGKKRRKADGDDAPVRVTTCPKCLAMQSPGRESCRYCGHIFQAAPRQIETVAGELSKVDPDALRARRQARSLEDFKAKTYEELLALGTSRGYDNPAWWAHMKMRARKEGAAA